VVILFLNSACVLRSMPLKLFQPCYGVFQGPDSEVPVVERRGNMADYMAVFAFLLGQYPVAQNRCLHVDRIYRLRTAFGEKEETESAGGKEGRFFFPPRGNFFGEKRILPRGKALFQANRRDGPLIKLEPF
jgi:hypothetical protein